MNVLRASMDHVFNLCHAVMRIVQSTRDVPDSRQPGVDDVFMYCDWTQARPFCFDFVETRIKLFKWSRLADKCNVHAFLLSSVACKSCSSFVFLWRAFEVALDFGNFSRRRGFKITSKEV